ncbi:hypothetical protein FJZ33_01845 [Candidatus Poribacteria bacterium]|nr:hypothetical protein [Candidatus Poribacteria bacterium]
MQESFIQRLKHVGFLIREIVKAFEEAPQTSLVYWPNNTLISLANYGAAYLWIMYLHEHYGGVPIIKALINNPLNGISGVNGALLSMGYSQRFEDVFSDWKVANLIDDIEFDSGKYGYKNLDLKVSLSKKYAYFPSSGNFQLSSWAANYIEFTGGNGVSNLEIEFKLRNPFFNFDVKTVTMKNGRPVNVGSVKIQDGKGFISIPKFGADVDTLILVPNWLTRIDADLGEVLSYSFSANLKDDIDFRVFVLPNAIHQRYLDFIVQVIPKFDLIGREGLYQTTYIPEISIRRSGKTLLEKQKMSYVPLGDKRNKMIYIYQFYVPYGWDGKEIQWSITYSGKSLDNGDLGKFLWVKKGK